MTKCNLSLQAAEYIQVHVLSIAHWQNDRLASIQLLIQYIIIGILYVVVV